MANMLTDEATMSRSESTDDAITAMEFTTRPVTSLAIARETATVTAAREARRRRADRRRSACSSGFTEPGQGPRDALFDADGRRPPEHGSSARHVREGTRHVPGLVGGPLDD